MGTFLKTILGVNISDTYYRWNNLSIDTRFWSKVNKTDTCWIWTSSLNHLGYGRFFIGTKKTISSHRYSFLTKKGKIPLHLVIDHICKTRNCVRPDHLRLLTRGENTLIGESFSAKNKIKTHCINGHEFSGYNLRYIPKEKRRVCRACKRDAQQRQYYKKESARKVTK